MVDTRSHYAAIWRSVAAFCLSVVTAFASASTVEEGFEGPQPSLSKAEADVDYRVLQHARVSGSSRGGEACEELILEAAVGTRLRVEQAIEPVRVIDELAASLWVRANRPDIALLLRVSLPRSLDPSTGRPIETTIAGSTSRQVDSWERLHVSRPAEALAKQLPALRAEHGPSIDLAEAVVTHVVLELYSSPGRYELRVDDLELTGCFPAEAAAPFSKNTAARTVPAGLPPAGATAAMPAADGPADASPRHDTPLPEPRGRVDTEVVTTAFSDAASGAPDDPPAGILRGVFEVGGLPFFPRVIDHNGEPLAVLGDLGFNTVRLKEPADGSLLEEARQTGMWIICPPPELPDVDVRDPASLPAFSPAWNRVLMWDLGEGLTAADVESVAERARRVKTCDLRPGRPVIASADSDLRSISRHVDMLLARRRVLGTSLELDGYLEWMRQQPRLARPGTPFLASLESEIDPLAVAQIDTLSGTQHDSLPVNAGSMRLAAYAAVAAGARGLMVGSQHRLDGDDPVSIARAAAARRLMIDLSILEPWAAAGRFASTASTSDPDVEAMVLEAVRARMVIAWRSAQGSQVVAPSYQGGLPDDASTVTIVVPGVPEPHRAWLVTSGGLRPLQQRRVTGGVSITLAGFRSRAFVLFSGDPAVTGSVQRQLSTIAAADLAASRSLASASLMRASELLGSLPPAALGKLPATEMLAEATRDAQTAESLVSSDPAAAGERFDRAAAIGQQFIRLVWERGVVATGSIVAGPLCTSEATLAEHWRFVETLAMTNPGENMLAGGGMNRIDDLATNGWRHFVLPRDDLRTSVEVSRHAPAEGSGCLRMLAVAADPKAPPVVVETPPVWVTSPPIEAPQGRLVEIEARVRVPKSLAGTTDGLLVFDNWGGPALAERVVGGDRWRRLVLYRIPPAGETPPPLVVTFALTGLGEASIDVVAVRVRARVGEPGSPQVLALPSSLPPPGQASLLAADAAHPPQQPAAPPVNRQPPTAGWSGTGLPWPSSPFGTGLPFGTSGPPPGEGGGRVDPFKRARQGG